MSEPRQLDLALQGGGAHGAFTWGVLDRLFNETDIEINAISGTSAGAMNAAVAMSAYLKKGPKAAQAALEAFWRDVAELGAVASPFLPNMVQDVWQGFNFDTNPAYNAMDMLSRMFSPYQLNPLNLNPLRDVLEKHVHIETLHEAARNKLFITATNVETGQARVFTCKDISVDALLASACLPFLFQAVEIDGAPYWDGGYMGNPVLWPLFYETPVDDVLLVQINPLVREGTPKTASAIINRLNEITFNASLVAEMRAIEFVRRLIEQEKLPTSKYRHVRMHRIELPENDMQLNASSKMNTSWPFFKALHDTGYAQADAWLKKNKHNIGVRATVDIKETFLQPTRMLPKANNLKSLPKS